MCGRYIFYDGRNEDLKEMIAMAQEKLPAEEFNEVSLSEVFPGQKAFAAVYDKEKEKPRLKVMKWGYSTHGRILINARSETCFTTPFYIGFVPCAVPASAYFEWTKDHEKYEFRTEEKTLYLGGLAHQEKNGWHFLIITEPATGTQAYVHERQPLVFSYEDAKKWCASEHPASLFINSIQHRSCEKARTESQGV